MADEPAGATQAFSMVREAVEYCWHDVGDNLPEEPWFTSVAALDVIESVMKAVAEHDQPGHTCLCAPMARSFFETQNTREASE